MNVLDKIHGDMRTPDKFIDDISYFQIFPFYPDSVNVLDKIHGDVRTPDKLINRVLYFQIFLPTQTV